MSDSEEHHFESKADAGASKTYPQQAGTIRKNGYIVIKSRPCKVVEVSTSKTGKHGHAKCHFVGIDIFNGKKLEDIVPSSHNCDVPHVNRTDYQLIDISEDGFVSLLKSTHKKPGSNRQKPGFLPTWFLFHSQFLFFFLFDMEQPENPAEEPIVSDRVIINGSETPLTLTADGKLRMRERGQRCLTVEKEVLGFVTEGSKIRIRAVVEGGGAGICCVASKGALVRKDFVFQPLSNDSLNLWSQKLRQYIDSLGRPKRLFVFVNPFGGKKSASKIFVDHVKPLFDDADVHITLQETQYQLHAKEVASSLDLSKYDGIVCVSGDGILVEVINGLLEREDWEAAIKMPVGVVPAGTGNGMVKSLLDSAGYPCTAPNAVLAIIRGHKRSLDVATILQRETKYFSILMLAWGLVADIDIESEKYRWMGSARIDFYGLQRILHLRQYNGRVSFVPAPGFETYGEPTSYPNKSIGKPDSCSPSEEESIKARHHGYQGPNIDLENLEWRTISGPFVSVWLHNVPWGGEGTLAAPDAKFSDGYLDLIIMRDCPQLDLLSLMTGLNDGSHVKSPHVAYLKVKAFVLEPGPRTKEPTKEGIIDSDGEVLARGKGTYNCDQKAPMAYDKLQMAVHQGLATLFSPL